MPTAPRTDELTDRLIELANAEGSVLFTRTVLGGHSALRFSIGARLTERRHVEAGWAVLQRIADGFHLRTGAPSMREGGTGGHGR